MKFNKFLSILLLVFSAHTNAVWIENGSNSVTKHINNLGMNGRIIYTEKSHLLSYDELQNINGDSNQKYPHAAFVTLRLSGPPLSTFNLVLKSNVRLEMYQTVRNQTPRRIDGFDGLFVNIPVSFDVSGRIDISYLYLPVVNNDSDKNEKRVSLYLEKDSNIYSIDTVTFTRLNSGQYCALLADDYSGKIQLMDESIGDVGVDPARITAVASNGDNYRRDDDGDHRLTFSTRIVHDGKYIDLPSTVVVDPEAYSKHGYQNQEIEDESGGFYRLKDEKPLDTKIYLKVKKNRHELRAGNYRATVIVTCRGKND
ncbi:hypothetical protein QWZ04_13070 [Vibrio tapetis subsp. quintayensis]|uniref:hypothetical protein n=1 Tax=Vibrio tapetis TaxID=52443 RepID=UPI0025B3AE53|nr:hypothetical protein [Vibrio tapetis]MDN3681252.1 hypothetical protein [Vibrio tapetis subsp. quintayensis]